MIESRNLNKVIHDELKPFGFKKKGATWYLEKDQVVSVLNLQKSNFGTSFFLNVGFWCPDLGGKSLPKIELCHVQSRVSEIFSTDPDIDDVLCGDLVLKNADRVAHLKDFLQNHLIPMMIGCSDIAELTSLLRAKEGFLVRSIAREFLGL